MDRAEEYTFVWGLLDEAGVILDDAERAKLCIRIGAGEYRETIIDLLQRFASSGTVLLPASSVSLRTWMTGFVGSDSEMSLRDLASRIRPSNASKPHVPVVGEHPPLLRVPRRSGHSARRLVEAERF